MEDLQDFLDDYSDEEGNPAEKEIEGQIQTGLDQKNSSDRIKVELSNIETQDIAESSDEILVLDEVLNEKGFDRS
eukprot:UN14032